MIMSWKIQPARLVRRNYLPCYTYIEPAFSRASSTATISARRCSSLVEIVFDLHGFLVVLVDELLMLSMLILLLFGGVCMLARLLTISW